MSYIREEVDMSDIAFNSMLTELDNLSYEQCVALLARLSKVYFQPLK